MDEPVLLERPERPVEPARVVALEPERPHALEQVVPVRRLLAQEQEDAWAQEIPRQRRIRS